MTDRGSSASRPDDGHGARPSRVALGVLTLVGLAVAACGSASAEGTIPLPSHDGAPGRSDDALISGVIRIVRADGTVCVWLTDGDLQWEVVWPRGFRVPQEGDPVVLDAGGDAVVGEGGRIRAGGAYLPATGTGCPDGAVEAVRIDRIVEAGP